MKCNGVKCNTPIMYANAIPSPSFLPDFGLQLPSSIPMGMPTVAMPRPTPTEIEAMMQQPLALPRPPFDNFVFKQKERYDRNLRG
jgi:hypothetical protein